MPKLALIFYGFLVFGSMLTTFYTQTGVFSISGFLVNHLLKKIVITPEPMRILTLNMDQ